MKDFFEPTTPLTADQIRDRLDKLGMSEVRRLISTKRITKQILLEAVEKIPKEKILERDALKRIASTMKEVE